MCALYAIHPEIAEIAAKAAVAQGVDVSVASISNADADADESSTHPEPSRRTGGGTCTADPRRCRDSSERASREAHFGQEMINARSSFADVMRRGCDGASRIERSAAVDISSPAESEQRSRLR